MDYIPPESMGDRSRVEVKAAVSQRNLWLMLSLAILATILMVVGWSSFNYIRQTSVPKARQSLIDAVKNNPPISSSLLANSGDQSIAGVSSVEKPVVVTIRKKDTLKRVFKRVGLDEKNAKTILALKQACVLKNLRFGKKLNLMFDPTKTKLQGLEYSIDDLNTLIVAAASSGWSAKIKHIEPTAATKFATATVRGSIYSAGKEAGVPSKLMKQFIGVFSQKVNINKIHKGDSFALFYNEYTLNGKKLGDSQITAAELRHKGKAYRVVSFTDPHGSTDFYTPDGRSIKPAFSRYPVNFKRIGDRFSLSRMHPILGYARPHHGVDFAAHFGTPVKATSNGKVAFAGSKSGYGRAIMIRQGVYSTLYAHLSRFSSNLYSGKHVKRGEVIGYVGSTGLATGPHLHYEFHVNGVPKDPLRVQLPTGEMIASEYRNRFFAQSRRLLAKLDLYRRDHRVFAMADESDTTS